MVRPCVHGGCFNGFNSEFSDLKEGFYVPGGKDVLLSACVCFYGCEEMYCRDYGGWVVEGVLLELYMYRKACLLRFYSALNSSKCRFVADRRRDSFVVTSVLILRYV